MAQNKRSTNFSAKEEHLLVCCVQEFKHKIENKKTDSNANRIKNETWIKIENNFNSQSGEIYRNANVLRKKYENLKKRTKTRFATEKCFRLGTGGGPPAPDVKLSVVDTTIAELIGETRIQGHHTQFGGDAGVENTDLVEEIIIETDETLDPDDVVLNVEVENNEKDPDMDLTNINTETNTNTWAKYTPELLKTPKSIILRSKENKGVRSDKKIIGKVSQWAEVKTVVESERRKYLDEEHKMKMEQMREAHELRMNLMKEESLANVKKIKRESDLVIEGLKEEQGIKIDILKLQKMQAMKNLKQK